MRFGMDMTQHTIDHNLIHGDLKIQITRTSSFLGENGNRGDVLSQVLLIMLKAADSNYDAVLSLVTKSVKFGTAGMIICRSTMELVFTICLLLSDPEKYLTQYLKAGWREQYAEYQYLMKDPINSDYPEWSQSFKDYLQYHASTVGLSDEERSNPYNIPYFPTPTQIIKQDKKRKQDYLTPMDVETREFLIKLNHSYYTGVLSPISHYSESGVAWQAGPLLWKEYPDDLQQLHISQPIGISIFILLSLLSEISIHFKLGNGQKLKELWTYMTTSVPLHRQLYEIKYQKHL